MTDFSGSLTPGARRAERFARLVDDDGPGVARVSDVALLELVGSLRAVPEAPAPDASYAADLRARLMAEADTALVPVEDKLVLPERTGRTRRGATVAAAALVLVGSSGGLALAAQGTLPGDPLYGVKRGLESVNAAMSLSDASRGRDLLGQSRTRLDEVTAMLDEDSDVSPTTQAAVRTTLQRFADSAARGSDLLFTSYLRSSSNDDVAAVRSFAGTSMRELDDAAAQAPDDLQDAFSSAGTMLTDVDQQARVLCAACGTREPLGLTDTLRAASATTSLDELIDPGTPASAPASAPSAAPSAGTPTAESSSPTTSSRGGAATSSSGQRSGGLSSTLGSLPGVGKVTGGAGSGTAGPGSQPPSLVKLPGSQSGAPAVIDLDKVTKDVTDGLGKTTDQLRQGLGGLGG